MAQAARDLALCEAFKREWLARGFDKLLPNGIYWGEALRNTKMPYAIFDLISVRRTGRSNQSRYLDASIQVKIYHRALDQAGAILDQIGGILDGDSELTMPSGEGMVIAFDEDTVSYTREEEGVWFAMADFMIRRVVPRLLPR
jgi:hypothetical protein